MSVSTNFPTVLQTSRRDIRVNRGKLNLFGRTLDAGALIFASALRKRYMERDCLNPFQSFILRRNRVGATIQHLHRHQHINLAPNLALTVLNWTTSAANVDHYDLLSIMPQLRRQREIQLIVTVTQRRETHLIEQLVDQIVARKARTEIGFESSPAQPLVPQIAEVQRVVRRESPSKTDQTLIAQNVDQTTEGKAQERKISNENYRAPESPVDLNRLTDQIIQAIDHRIIAQRERLGRV
jgi:hypothetical protein